MKVLSMDGHLSRYLALNRGRISAAAKRNRTMQSRTTTVRAECFNRAINAGSAWVAGVLRSLPVQYTPRRGTELLRDPA